MNTDVKFDISTKNDFFFKLINIFSDIIVELDVK